MTSTAIMVRAAITRDEWAALRKLAIDLNTAPARLVAEALRLAYPLSPPIERTDDGDSK